MSTAIETKTTDLATIVDKIQPITAGTEFDMAGERLNEVIALKDEIDGTFKPITSAAFAAHKEAKKQHNKHLAEPLRLEGILRALRGNWVREREALAEANRRRIAEEARVKAEEEAKKKAEDEALDLAEALMEAGEEQQAEEVLEEPVKVAPVVTFDPPPLPRIPEQKGFKDKWEYTITDESALMTWLWNSYRGLLLVDESGIRKMVEHDKEDARRIPGINVTCRKVESVRR